MLTDVQIINNGLSLGASSRIKRIDPAQTPLESYMASNYPQWKRSELSKRRWVFALEKDYVLTLVATLTTSSDGRNYKYTMPIDCLRPLRSRTTEWVQRGRHIYSAYDTLSLDYIRNAPESDFDPLFNDVLSAAIWMKSCEYVTQSATKTADAKEKYLMAVREAGQANAYIIGPEETGQYEGEPSWLDAHMYG